MSVKWYSSEQVIPLHPPYDAERYSQLKRSFEEKGWDLESRPLAGVDFGDKVVAFTGAHRIAVCQALGIDIPVYNLNRAVINPDIMAKIIEPFDPKGAELIRKEEHHE